MNARTVVLDPTSEDHPLKRKRSRRPQSLAGLTIGLLDISKPRGDIFLNRLEDHLYRLGVTVERYAKPTFTKPAPADLRKEIATSLPRRQSNRTTD
ncbi:TPA: hypothetical protein EYN98_33690 [Candidatus Poribacteria bacterium]|nr:hypothetical protein [Candidatus Poribacteria bacterium]